MKALRLLVAALLFSSSAQAQFSGASSGNGGTANPPIPDLSMCAARPTSFAHVWSIDPVNGHTAAFWAANPPSSGIVGDASNPWDSYKAVFASQTGYTVPLLTTAGAGGGPIAPGDEILLNTGTAAQYGGPIVISSLNPASFVTTAAASGQTPILYSIAITGSSHLAFDGLTIQGVNTGGATTTGMIVLQNGGGLPIHDIVFDHATASSASNATTSGWSETDWLNNAAKGVYISGQGVSGAAYCMAIRNSHIFNAGLPFTFFADNSVVDGNEIERFGFDGLDYAGSNLVIRKNYIHDFINFINAGGGAAAHIDGMQGFTGRLFNNDILIDSNTIIYETDPSLPFNTDTNIAWNGGIGADDEDWTRVTVINNIIVWPNHGIVFEACHYCVIAGNTVLPTTTATDRTTQLGGELNVSISKNVTGYRPSSGIVVRNNLVGFLNISDPTAFVDHNIMMMATLQSGSTSFLVNYAVGGGFIHQTPTNTAYSNGSLGTNNLVDSTGYTGELPGFSNGSTFSFDFHLASGAQARGYGVSATPTPTVDINGNPRAPTHDVGAQIFQ